MEPIQLFDDIFYQRIGKYAGFCGAAVLYPNYRPTALTAFWVSMNGMFLVWSGYTFAHFDSVTVWKMLTIFGLACQGFVKFINVLYFAPVIGRNVTFLRTVYAANRRRRTPNYAILERWSRLSWHLCRYATILINSTCLLLVPLTIVSNWLLAEHELPLPVHIPLVDTNTGIGWAVMFLYDTVMLILGGVGTCAVDLLLLMLVLQMWPMSDILEVQFEQLNEAVRSHREQQQQPRRIRWFFRNILLTHKEICDYMGDISDAYFYIITVEIYTIGLSLCALIFCYLTITWFTIYFMTALMLAKLLGFCLLGTIVELTTDRILSTVVNSDWYLLPLELQLMYLRIVQMAQNPAVLQAGTIPVNLDFMVSVLKTVYSVGMLLIETVAVD